MCDLLNHLQSVFADRYPGAAPPLVARAPGRLNLIGEHTDYNQGLVLPVAIDRALYVLAAPGEGRVEVWADDFAAADTFDPACPEVNSDQLWANYVRGMAWALGQAGLPCPPARLVIGGNLPLAAGVSSSAALETSAGLALLALAGRQIPPRELALLAQKAENEFVGVQCGIMDQFAVGLSEAGAALLLDCRSLATEVVPLAGEIPLFYVCDTARSRELAASAYNERRQQCEGAARHLGVPSLREVTRAALEGAAAALGPVVTRRCRHVLSENERVLEAVKVMGQGDWAAFGRLLSASHASLRDDYEVSCYELDVMCEEAEAWPGCLGARMVGAGFGGCAMAAVDPARADGFAAALKARYQARTSLTPQIFAVTAGPGASLLTPIPPPAQGQ